MRPPFYGQVFSPFSTVAALGASTTLTHPPRLGRQAVQVAAECPFAPPHQYWLVYFHRPGAVTHSAGPSVEPGAAGSGWTRGQGSVSSGRLMRTACAGAHRPRSNAPLLSDTLTRVTLPFSLPLAKAAHFKFRRHFLFNDDMHSTDNWIHDFCCVYLVLNCKVTHRIDRSKIQPNWHQI